MRIQPRRVLLPAALVAVASLGGCAGPPTQREAAATEQLEQGRVAWRQGDYQAALEPLKAAAARGQVRALYALGYMHFYGRGVPQDRARGIEMIRRAAKAGDALAIEALGVIADARGISRQHRPSDRPASPGAAAEGPARVTTQDEIAAAHSPPADAEGTARAAPKQGIEDPTYGNVAGKGGMAWLRQRDPEHFTIELLAVRDRETVRRYRELYLTRSPPPEPVQVVEVVRRGRSWLLLVMGDYPDRAAARRVIEGLPPLLRAGKPQPLQFRGLIASGPQAALGGD